MTTDYASHCNTCSIAVDAPVYEKQFMICENCKQLHVSTHKLPPARDYYWEPAFFTDHFPELTPGLRDKFFSFVIITILTCSAMLVVTTINTILLILGCVVVCFAATVITFFAYEKRVKNMKTDPLYFNKYQSLYRLL